MKSFTLITGTLLALACALSLAQAGSKYGGYGGSGNGGSKSMYGGGGSGGSKYNGNSNKYSIQQQSGYGAATNQGYGSGLRPAGASSSAHGPYHSYAVRPAVYGGHGMYNYRGYARHPPAPRAHYRPTRSYGSGPAQYGMRPVKAIAVASASYGGQSSGGYSKKAPSHGGYQSSRPNNKGGYSRKKRAYGGNRRPSSHYGGSSAASSPSYSSSSSSSYSSSNRGYNGGNGNGYSQGRGQSHGGYAKKAASSAGGY